MHNSLWLLAQPIVLGLFSLALFSFAASELGKKGLGLFTEASSFALFFLGFAGLGLSPVATRAIARDRPNARAYASTLVGLRMVVVTIVVAITVAAAALGSEGVRSEGLVYLAILAIPLDQGMRTMQDLFIGLERARLVSIASAVGAVMRIGLSFGALLLGYGLWGFTAGWLVADATTIVFCVLVAPDVARLRPRFDRVFALAAVRKGFVFYLTQLLTTAYQRLDVLLLGWVAGHEELGLYAVAIGLVRRLIVIAEALGMATYAGVSAAAQRDRAVAHAMARRSHELGLAVSVPIAAAVTILSGPIVTALFGPEFLPAALPLAIAGWAVPLWASAYVSLYTLSAVDREKQVLGVAAVITGVAVAGLLAAGSGLNATIASVCVVGAQAVGTALFLRRTKRELGSLVGARGLGKVALATGAFAVALFLAKPLVADLSLGHALLPRVGLVIVLGTAVYAAIAVPIGLLPFRLLRTRHAAA